MSNNLALNIEKIKKEKDGIDVLADIYFHAVFGEKISLEDLERFKWYGIYAQDDEQNYFKLKIPLSMGELNLTQLKTFSLISKEFSNDCLIFSDEQKIEFLNLKIFDLPKIFRLLQEVNLNTFFEAGHTIRRVLTCPINTIDDSQVFNVSTLAKKLDETFIGNKKFSNLPNSLQMAISGHEEGCNVQTTPEVSFNATTDNKDKIIFMIKILDVNIGYISPAQVINTAKAIAEIYRDFGDRENFSSSSFEHLVKKWGMARFFDILNSSTNYKIQRNISTKQSTTPRNPRMGINKSSIEGESYIGCKITSSKIENKSLDSLSNLLEKYSASKIKITHKGNIIILDAPSKSANDFAKELEKINFNPFV